MDEERRQLRRSFEIPEEPSLWVPRVDWRGKMQPLPVREDDRHVVVDDMDEDVVVVEVSPWPWLDRGKRLRFGAGRERKYTRRHLQEAVNAQRKRHRQPAWDRPLRVGDAFWMRGKGPLGKLTIVDITRTARAQAKCAFYGAVAAALSRSEAEERGLLAEVPEAAPRPRRRRAPSAVAVPEI